MKNWLAKQLIKRYQPVLVFVMGSFGKSMAIASCQTVVEKNMSLSVQENVDDVSQAVINSSASSFVGALLNLFLGRSYPDIVFLELNSVSAWPEDVLILVEKMLLIVPWVSEADKQDAEGVKKYLLKNCALLKNKKDESEGAL